MSNQTPGLIGSVSVAGLFILGGIFLSMWGCPKYNVYSQEMEGRAQLAHAQSSKEVAVAEAKAKMESALLSALHLQISTFIGIG